MSLPPEQSALELDQQQPPLRRDDFHLLPFDGEQDTIAYLVGNSLGLQPKVTPGRLQEELDVWATLGVEGHMEGKRPWLSYHELLRDPAARLVGALPSEVVMMNSLTVNLHLMMISFYRPTAERHRIVIEDTAFPSDSYAVRSQAALHGHDPDEAVVRLTPREGEHALRSEDVVTYLEEHGDQVALVLLGGVNYYSGELLDIEAITAAGHAAGSIVAIDLAHAAGNVPLKLHDWGVDWAAWCTYKYLNSGPGATAGAFVHERHLKATLPKLHGWWSTEPDVRFHMGPVVDAPETADSWSISGPAIIAMTPVLASLEMFDEVGMDALRERSLRLTAYLDELLTIVSETRPMRVITPSDPKRRGAQLSVQLDTAQIEAGDIVELNARMRHEYGVIADVRQPDVIRLAPAPMYSTFRDCWRAAHALAMLVPER